MLTIPSANLCTLIVANLIQDLDSDFTYHVIDECNGDDIQIARRLAKESRVQMAKLDGFLMANAQWEVLDFIDKDDKEVTKQMAKFNTHVRLRPYIEGHRLSFSDIHQFVLLGASVNYDPTKILGGQQAFAHVTRWFLNLKNMPVITRSIAMASVKTLTVKERVDCSTTLDKLEAAFASKLPNAVMGKVKTRFAPEPSGYLHLGHTKAALINMFFARYFGGEMIVRFDDTNPTKEKAEFENSIIEDLRTLGIEVPTVSYTSDEFPRLEKAMEDMIRQGKAYIDTTPVELMRAERFDGIASACRDVSVELNLKRWADMLAGNEEGQKCCVRVKIDMQSKNKCMRDPVAYRVNVTDTHHKTGNSYKAYPTYDFACPLVDSWTGITHALRSNEYADRIPQYYWFQDAMKIPRTTVYEFSRLNLSNTVLSKRKLNWLVNTGKVDGWEDPRLPTVRGLIRRGLTVQAIYEFLMEQGPSKNANLMEWDKLWSKNAKVLDPISPRFMAINAQYASLEITNFQDDRLPRERLLFPKDKSKGTVPIIMQPVVALEREDASACELDEMITLMRIGNVHIDQIDNSLHCLKGHLVFDSDFKATKKKLHWTLPEPSYQFWCREYDHIITKKKPEETDTIEDLVNENSLFDTLLIGEQELHRVKSGDYVQLERRGFFRVDSKTKPHPKHPGQELPIFVKIPDGKMKAMSVVSTMVNAATLSKGGDVGKGADVLLSQGDTTERTNRME